MECNFFVGQKVVCVDANGASRFTGSTTPWEPDEQISDGEIYTITSVHLFHGLIVLHLQEVQRSISTRMLWGPLAGYGPSEPVMRLTKLGREKLAALGIDPKDVRIES